MHNKWGFPIIFMTLFITLSQSTAMSSSEQQQALPTEPHAAAAQAFAYGIFGITDYLGFTVNENSTQLSQEQCQTHLFEVLTAPENHELCSRILFILSTGNNTGDMIDRLPEAFQQPDEPSNQLLLETFTVFFQNKAALAIQWDTQPVTNWPHVLYGATWLFRRIFKNYTDQHTHWDKPAEVLQFWEETHGKRWRIKYWQTKCELDTPDGADTVCPLVDYDRQLTEMDGELATLFEDLRC